MNNAHTSTWGITPFSAEASVAFRSGLDSLSAPYRLDRLLDRPGDGIGTFRNDHTPELHERDNGGEEAPDGEEDESHTEQHPWLHRCAEELDRQK